MKAHEPQTDISTVLPSQLGQLLLAAAAAAVAVAYLSYPQMNSTSELIMNFSFLYYI